MSHSDNVNKLVSFGGTLAGAAAGAALGFFAGGPGVAAAGSMAGVAVSQGIQMAGDFVTRELSRKERARVGAGFAFAYAKIRQNFKEGLNPRDDGFFDRDYTERFSAEQILEGVLLKCRDAYEEKKCRYISYIYANVAFMPNVSVAAATHLLQWAERLTYRQLCVIALVERAGEMSMRTGWGKYPVFRRHEDHPDQSLVVEVRDFSGLVHGMGSTSDPPFLETLGSTFYRATSLEEIPRDDLQPVAELIKWGEGEVS